MNAKRVIFIGDASHREYRDAVAWMREYCELNICGSVEAASRYLAGLQDPPQAIVLGQVRPGVLRQGEIERLQRQAWPARLIELLGGWCEGELRSSEPLRAATPVYWHRFIAEIGPSLQRQAAPGSIQQRPHENTLVAVRSISRDSFEALSDACQAIGHSTVWLPQARTLFGQRVACGIWDCDSSIHADREALGEFARRLHPAPIVAVLGFPRVDDCEAALAYGAACVLSKPHSQPELWSALAGFRCPPAAGRGTTSEQVRLACASCS